MTRVPPFLSPDAQPAPRLLTPHDQRRASQIANITAMTRPEPPKLTLLDQVRAALSSRDPEALRAAGLALLREAER